MRISMAWYSVAAAIAAYFLILFFPPLSTFLLIFTASAVIHATSCASAALLLAYSMHHCFTCPLLHHSLARLLLLSLLASELGCQVRVLLSIRIFTFMSVYVLCSATRLFGRISNFGQVSCYLFNVLHCLLLQNVPNHHFGLAVFDGSHPHPILANFTALP